jgi:hypothetical protein
VKWGDLVPLMSVRGPLPEGTPICNAAGVVIAHAGPAVPLFPTTERLLEQLRASYVDPPRRLCDPWPEGEPMPAPELLLWDGDQA